jgi:hypothetical protein
MLQSNLKKSLKTINEGFNKHNMLIVLANESNNYFKKD